MAIATRTYSSTTDVVAGADILAAHINTDLDKLYTLQNGAIDNANISASAAIAISKTALGTYTPWAAFTTTLGVEAGNYTDVTKTSRWMQIGKTVICQIYANGTFSGTPLYITATLPVAPAIDTDLFVATGGLATESPAVVMGCAVRHVGSGTIRIYRFNGAVFATGANGGFSIQLAYEVA